MKKKKIKKTILNKKRIRVMKLCNKAIPLDQIETVSQLKQKDDRKQVMEAIAHLIKKD